MFSRILLRTFVFDVERTKTYVEITIHVDSSIDIRVTRPIYEIHILPIQVGIIKFLLLFPPIFHQYHWVDVGIREEPHNGSLKHVIHAVTLTNLTDDVETESKEQGKAIPLPRMDHTVQKYSWYFFQFLNIFVFDFCK